jgi:hypothetical protein
VLLSNFPPKQAVMRIPVALFALLLPVVAVADAPPPLAALAGFQPGAWQVKVIGSASSSSQCLVEPLAMLIGGRPAQECQFRTIADGANSATVTYRCAGGRSGRTVVRRDAGGLFVVDAQGLENGHPFADRTEWRRTGAC